VTDGFSITPIHIIPVTKNGERKLIEVKITDRMLLAGRKKATEMGLLHNSILRGGGSIAGFLGEQIVLDVMGGKWDNSYDYDIVLGDGRKVEVKTKQTSAVPLPHYSCSISNFNTRQKCDIYAFTRVLKDFSKGWFLGYMPKQEYFDKSKFMKKGDFDPDNGYEVRADCYNLYIEDLQNVQDIGSDMLLERT